MVTRETLLETDPLLENRYYQVDALLGKDDEFRGILHHVSMNEKCLVKMACGSGKSILITNTIIHAEKMLNVVVFPSLGLINQYAKDYLFKAEYKKYFEKYQLLNVSSEYLRTIESTTDPLRISAFLKSDGQKLIVVTYQSLQVLLTCLDDGQKIGLIAFDEAHRVNSKKKQKLVFGTDYYEAQVFFTATPENKNDVIMFDRENPEKNMCGPLAYEYPYLQGVKDGFLNAFEVCVDMYTEESNNSLYEIIARSILSRQNNRVLSFHSAVKKEGKKTKNTNVWGFVDEEAFKTAFHKVLQTEFSEKGGYYTGIIFCGMDGTTPPHERKALLDNLEATPIHKIFILSSCQTLCEGIDTKKANTVFFADPKKCIREIWQNIGRVTRPNPEQPVSIILIPCFIDMAHYAEANGDRVKQDELIRQQMQSVNGDYVPILNVSAALKQEDPDIHDMCLYFPNREHKEASLNEQGFQIAGDDGDGDGDEMSYTPEEVEEMKANGEPLEIHTNETIERFNDDDDGDEPMTRLYHDAEDDSYKPIVRLEASEADASASEADASASEADASEADASEADASEADADSDRQIIQPPVKPNYPIKMSIHTSSSDIQMLWGVKGALDFSKKFCSVVIECDVSYGVEKWKQSHDEMKNYINKKGSRPPQHTDCKITTTIANWIGTQKRIYHTEINQSKCIMKNPEVHALWTATINDEKYAQHLVIDFVNDWKRNLSQLKQYIEDHNKTPTIGDSMNFLGYWMSRQKKIYHIEIKQSECIMKNPEVHALWTATINDEKYAQHLVIDFVNDWKRNLSQLKQYIEDHNKMPPHKTTLGKWASRQKENYHTEISQSKCTVKNPEVHKLWSATLNDEKYAGHIVIDFVNVWKQNLVKLTDYIDANNALPSTLDENLTTKSLAGWLTLQKRNYRLKEGQIQNPLIRDLWEKTYANPTYAKHLDNLTEWNENHIKMKNYIKKHNKRPSNHDKDACVRTIANWINKQRRMYHPDITKSNDIMQNSIVHESWSATFNDPEYKKHLVALSQLSPINKINCECGGKYTGHNSSKNRHDASKKHEDFIKRQQSSATVETSPAPTKKRKRSVSTIVPAAAASSTTAHHFPPPSDIGVLHQQYLRMSSTTLHTKFQSEPQLWREYHATRKRTFADRDPASIPCNMIIRELEQIQTKRRKIVVDMGCGEAPIANHFLQKGDERFTFYNYDHHSGGDPRISEADISALPLADASTEIAIMSLALWGTQTNCTQYIKEAHRVLESGGKFYISDSLKKWSPDPLTPANAGELLRTLLTTNGFKVITEDVAHLPFCLFTCLKDY